MRKHPGSLAISAMAVLGVSALSLPSGDAMAANRIFPLHIENRLSQPVTFKISSDGHSCYEGQPAIGGSIGPLASGAKATITLARVQGHGCDGRNGYFVLEASDPRFKGDGQTFTFDNAGTLAALNVPNSFNGSLSATSATDESYTWSIGEVDSRLSKPRDAQLTQPKNPIANDSGAWGPTARVESFPFLNQPQLGLWGNFYDDCVGIELFHPQHVIRLPNKDGRAYFVVAQSRAHNGWISVLETDPGVVDPATDLIVSQDPNKPIGKYIWQDLYRWKDQVPNPVGNWNHPGKMDQIGGVLVVAAQNWGESAPCFYGKGESVDKVLFYDIRDPRQPRYWGAIEAAALGVGEISTVGLVRTPNNDYLLSVGGNGTYTTWTAREISPDITKWTRIQPNNSSFSGQHGMNFNSYQKSTVISDKSAPAGVERVMYFDSAAKDQAVGFSEFSYDPSSRMLAPVGGKSFQVSLIGALRVWDSDSVYISTRGMPIIYTMNSDKGENGRLYQVHMPQ
ncbi:hypothetical protein [Candidatus Accumulibacter sp. ACC003]|uniref:hypothetical protein n=1 Tax=Candidatus Accumulibacter sp. ACC003 TaxID=2823334 RepID=UPI0025B7E09B|nr:hypothetical protein [Candidatus Accumulibacter sp. ACC003]